MISKTKQNDKYIESQRAEGREYCLLGELPHPEVVAMSHHVLAVEGIKVYLRTLDLSTYY